MAGKNTAVFGIYSNRTSVESAVDALKTAEFRNSDISVLFPENTGTKDFAHEKNTKAPEGATTGAGTGALLGGGLGWLVGTGALAIPGLGPFIAAGPIVAALAGAGRSEEHTSELQSRLHLVCRLLLEKKKNNKRTTEMREQRYIVHCSAHSTVRIVLTATH